MRRWTHGPRARSSRSTARSRSCAQRASGRDETTGTLAKALSSRKPPLREAVRSLARDGHGRVADPRAWRLPSRPGAGGAGRRLYHRFRGRAGPAHGRSGARNARRCATSPVCCARSIMRPRRPRRAGRQPRNRRGSAAARCWHGSATRRQRRSSTPTDPCCEAERPWVPPRAEPALLDLFLIEKAAYEIRYEAANRPTWLGIPLQGLHRSPNACSHTRRCPR